MASHRAGSFIDPRGEVSKLAAKLFEEAPLPPRISPRPELRRRSQVFNNSFIAVAAYYLAKGGERKILGAQVLIMAPGYYAIRTSPPRCAATP